MVETTRKPAVSVMLAEPHLLVRGGLRCILEQSGLAHVVAETGDGREVLARALRLLPDVLLLDVSIPGKDCLEVLADVRVHLPNLRVIMLSALAADNLAPLARSLGASGYVDKDMAAPDLVSAVLRVVNGGECFDGSGASRIGPRHGFGQLSGREVAVMEGIAHGLHLTRIADDLRISPKSVTTYRRRLLDKLGLSSNAELVSLWLLSRRDPGGV